MTFKKLAKTAASLITQTSDDDIGIGSNVDARNLVDKWNQLAVDYNTRTPTQRSATKKEFVNFTISQEESHLYIKQR